MYELKIKLKYQVKNSLGTGPTRLIIKEKNPNKCCGENWVKLKILGQYWCCSMVANLRKSCPTVGSGRRSGDGGCDGCDS